MTDCPDVEHGPFHMWTCDGPFTVCCENCDADGRITVTPAVLVGCPCVCPSCDQYCELK